jgi:hypothetical protein
MGFRGCDEGFEEALDIVSRNPREFGIFVQDFIASKKQRERDIESNSEILLKEYGIKYCPFHSKGLVENVEPNRFGLNVGGIDYDFIRAICSSWRYCETPISFDEGLIKSVSEMDLRKVVIKETNGCTTCRDNGGSAYFVGFRSPAHIKDGSIKKSREFSNDIPIYFFDGSGSCGHSYVFTQSFAAPELVLEEKGKMGGRFGRMIIG